MLLKRIYFLLLLPLLLGVAADENPARIVRAGVYNNPPLVFIDENDTAQGFFVDVLEEIAQEEGWELTFVPCEWDACLNALDKGEIDLLGPIAYSLERLERFDFSGETLLTNWGQIYIQNGETNASIIDLDGKIIALLREDIHAEEFLSITARFGINPEILYCDSYVDVMRAVESREAFAGVINHFFALQHARDYSVEQTEIIFNPIEVRFATTKGANAELLTTLDRHIVALKSDQNSLYYRSLNIWLYGERSDIEWANWVFWIGGGLILFLGLLLGINLLLRRQVHKQTLDLEKSRAELALIMDRIPSMIAYVDREQRYIYVDESYADWYGLAKEDVVGKLIKDILPPENYAKVRPKLEQMISSGEMLQYEHTITRHDGEEALVAISYIPKLNEKGEVEAFFATVRDVSEQHKAAAALQESETKYRQLVDNSLVGIYIIQKSRIKFANQGLADLFGYEKAEDMLDIVVQRVIVPEDWAKVKQEIDEKETGLKKKSLFSFKGLRLDGSRFDVEVVSEAILYEGKLAIQGVLVDITARVEAEERFRSLSEASYEAIFISERGICLEQNLAAENLFGYSLEEAVGRPSTDWIIQEDRDKVIHHILTGYEEPYLVKALRKDGSTFPAQITGRMMEYRGRKVRVTALRDITQQVKAEEYLHESEEKYRNIFENATEGMFQSTFDGRFLMANPATAKIYGYETPEELIREVKDISTDLYVDSKDRDQLIYTVKSSTQMAVFVEKNRRKDGSIIWVSTKARGIRDENQNPLYIEGFVEDVTKRIESETKLRQSKERFENVIAHSPVPMVITDDKGDLEYINEKFTELFGYTLEDVPTAEAWWSAAYPDEEYRTLVQESWEKAIEKATEEKTGIATQTWKLTAKDRSVHVVEFDMMPLGDISVIAMNDITERVQAEQKLKERERKLKEAQKIGRMGHWELDLLTDKLIWSDEIYRIFKVDPQTFLSSYSAFLEKVHPDDRELVGEAYTRSLEDQEPYDIVHRLLLDDEEVRYIRERCETEYDQHGKPLRSLGTVQDITEQVQSEQMMKIRVYLAEFSLTHSMDEVLQKTLDEAENLTGSKIGFYHFLDEKQIDLSLQAWSTQTINGYCSVENIERHYPVDQAGVWVDCIRTRQPVIHNDYASLKHHKGLPAGHAELIRELVVPVLRGNKIVAILGVGNKPTDYDQRDIDVISLLADLCWEVVERKLAEESLAENEKRLRTLINATPDIICFKDGQGRWLAANDADLQLFQLEDVDYVGKTDRELASYSDFYQDAFLACEDTDEIAWQAMYLSRQNEIIPTPHEGNKVYDVIKVPLFNSDGSRQGLVVLGRDITERIVAQNTLEKHSEQLEIVNTIAAALSTSLALEDVLNIILQQVVRVIPCDSAAIFLAEADNQLKIVNAIGNATAFLGHSFPLKETLMQGIPAGQKSLILDDVTKSEYFFLWDENVNIRGWMGLPLYARDSLVGYLTFDSLQPQAYSPRAAALAESFAPQVAQAIYNARLYERVIQDANDLEKHVQKRTEELQNFVDITAGREIRMIELKEMISKLRAQLIEAGQAPVTGDFGDSDLAQ